MPPQNTVTFCPRLLIRREYPLISQLTFIFRCRPTIRNPVDALGGFKLSREPEKFRKLNARKWILTLFWLLNDR